MKIGCIILAGGKSSRMGEDKALLEYNGEKFIDKIADPLNLVDKVKTYSSKKKKNKNKHYNKDNNDDKSNQSNNHNTCNHNNSN